MGFVRLLALTLLIAANARAAELAGVTMPDAEDAGGTHLVLNGVALRTYSILQFRVYVAGLYLPSRSANPASILGAAQPVMLRFVFLRDVGADAARRSWQDSLAASCRAPCQLPPDEVNRFLAGIPPVHKGDVSTMLFTGSRMEIAMNGRMAGEIPDPAFARVILSTFIGDHPTADNVKRGLLGQSAS